MHNKLTAAFFVLIATILLLTGCHSQPQVEFSGLSGEIPVTELTDSQFSGAWLESTKAFKAIVGVPEYCTAKAVFSKAADRSDIDSCKVLYQECITADRVTIPVATFDVIGQTIHNHCKATVNQVRTCYNEALKIMASGLRAVDCTMPPHRIDQKLGVPQSCRELDNSCIRPVLRELVMSDWELEE
jgi:hypothetical protein